MKNKAFIKTLSAILTVVMVLCSAPLSGFTGIRLPYFFSVRAEASIEGNFNYYIVSGEATLTGCVDATGDIVIPETLDDYPVTSIGSSAFYYCNSLTSITIPDSVKRIGEGAFRSCDSLTSVTIGNSVTSIGSSAFAYCDSLISVAIPDSVTSIGSSVFSNCTSLTSVEIPDRVTSIGFEAFYYCDSLSSVTIGNSVTSVGDYAFFGCTSLTSVIIPDSVTSIGYHAFYSCDSLTSITIGNGVTSIDAFTFWHYPNLTSVTVGNSVTRIGGNMFSDCTRLTSVTIGRGVTSIGRDAFSGCTSLARVYYTGDIESWCGIEFEYATSNPMYYAKNFYINNTLVKEIVIPDTVTEIKDDAFYSFEGITSVTIPDSVTSIGFSAFYNCTGLTSITIPDSVTNIGDSAFYNCTGLISVTVGNCVTRIGRNMFSGCTRLTAVTIGRGVTSIGRDAFSGCTSLARVYYTGDIESWCSISFGYYASNPMYNSSAKNFYIGGELLENIIIPSNIEAIKSDVFNGFSCIKSITIPESVITIHENAFYNCRNIEKVIFEGTESQWEEIAIYDGNDYLVNAEITFLNGGHEHSYTSSVTTEPTCTEDGVKTFKCGCGDTYTEVIPATGHTWSKWIVTTEPTEADDGFKGRFCTACEDAAEIEVIPATGSDDEKEADFTITLTDENGNIIIKEVVSDGNTDVSFENGTYTLTITRENYVSKTFTVTASDNMMSIDFILNKVGDITGDGKVNTVDVARANSHAKSVTLLSDYAFECADVNGDGKVNTIDVARMNSHAKGVTTLW